ncbi:MAG: pilus assembly PilX N-terminal domain-containing protein [Pseudoalteromonas distincta]
MKFKSGMSNFETQRGAALAVALVILLMVSVLGLTAIRSSIFSAKVSTGVQADAMAFEAAENAIAAAYSSLAGMSDQQLFATVESTPSESCLKGSGFEDGVCATTDFMDERQLLRSQSFSYLSGYQAISGNQVSVSGNASVFVDYRIDVLGQSEMPAYNIENHHLQETLKRGIKPGSDVE